jgi:hypothetical protein
MVLYVGVSNVPLSRDIPVKDWRARGNFESLQGNALPDESQSLPNAVTRDASADRVEFCREAMKLSPDCLRALAV